MQSDFSQGKVWKNVINQAIPLMVAQLIQILYNVVDRIYIGHLPVIGSNALTGIGLVFPITTLVAAFTNLFSTGGVPLFSMARGAKEEKKASLWERFINYMIENVDIIAPGIIMMNGGYYVPTKK